MFNFIRKRKFKKELKKHDKSYVKNPIKLPEIPILKKYEYKILLLNHETLEGECSVACEDELAEMFLRNKYTICKDNKIIWYNSDNFVYFEAKEIKKGEK